MSDGSRLDDAQRKRLQGALKALGPAVILCVVAGYVNHRHFLPAFLVALLFTTAMTIGGQFFVLLQHALGARSAVVARRPMEWLSQGIAFMFVLWLVVIFGGHYMYAWWPAASGDDWISHWFRRGAFGGRLYLYLVIWTSIASRFFRASHKQDKEPDPKRAARLRKAAWPTLLLSFATACAAAGDWILGLDVAHVRLAAVPLAGAYFVALGMMSALAVLAIFTVLAQRAGLMRNVSGERELRAIARWSALAVIAGAAATAAFAAGGGATWRAHWTTESWQLLTYLDAGIGVAALALLLVAPTNPRALVGAAGLSLCAGLVGAYQVVMPTVAISATPHWTLLGAVAGSLTAIWLPLVLRASDNPLYPINDPLLAKAP